MPKAERDPFKIECGNRLRRAIQALGYSVNQFAYMTLADEDDLPSRKRAEDKIYKHVNGEALVPIPYVRRLRPQFGITLDYIYDGDKSALPADLRHKLITQEREDAAAV